MRFDQMAPSKYLKKDDCQTPQLLTIHSFQQENVARDDQPAEMKWVVYFNEIGDKGMVLNSTNLQLLQMATGTEDSDLSIGMKIVLYNDPSITYMGKVTGGLRIRAPKNQAARPAQVPAAAPPVPAPVIHQQPRVVTPPATVNVPAAGEDDSDVPF